jgi:hypothetical protein
MGALLAGQQMVSSGMVTRIVRAKAVRYGQRPTVQPAAWGELEKVVLPLEPDDAFVNMMTLPEPSKWVFTNYSRKQLTELFDTCGLTYAQKLALNPNRWEALTNGFAIAPTDELELGLSPKARQKLYSILARNPDNVEQNLSFRFPEAGFDEWFAGSGLLPEKVNLVRGQTYTNGGWLCFSTVRPVCALLTKDESRLLIKRLHRIPALTVRLRVTPESNPEALIKYWGRGGREQSIRPLIESLARIPDGQSISIAGFLPPFAQMRLNTYADPRKDSAATEEDCYFTALNFFNTEPDQQFLETRQVRDALLTDYCKTQDEPLLGDLLLYFNAANKPVHICVYVADDVVFTKNGGTFVQPWVLMKIPDMLAGYSMEKPLQTVRLRRKDFQSKPRTPSISQNTPR